MINFLKSLLPTRTVYRSLENPNTPISDADVFLDWGGTLSGENVNQYNAYRHPSVWRAVQLISSDIAKIPFITWQVEGRARERFQSHPLYRVLRYRPNRNQTAQKFWKMAVSRVLFWGNFYARIIRLGGSVQELLPLHPQRVRAELDANGNLYYVYTRPDGGEDPIAARNMLHVMSLQDDSREGIVGISYVKAAQQAIGLGLAAEAHGALYFRNGAKPNVFLKVPKQLSKEGRAMLRDTWPQARAKHGPVVGEEGMEIDVFDTSNEDAQYVETREFQDTIVIANVFGLPPSKLANRTSTSYNSLEMEQRAYLSEALDPHLVAFEQECRFKLLTEEEQDSDAIQLEFLRKKLINPTIADQGEFWSKAINAGWMLRDEVRDEMNLNPLPEGEGEVLTIPVNQTTVEKLESEDDSEPATLQADNVDDERARKFLVLWQHVERSISKALSSYKRASDKETWDLDHVVGQGFRSYGRSIALLCGGDIEDLWDDFSDSWDPSQDDMLFRDAIKEHCRRFVWKEDTLKE